VARERSEGICVLITAFFSEKKKIKINTEVSSEMWIRRTFDLAN
jgi:hypothetical protein